MICNFKYGGQGKPSRKVISEQKTEGGEGVSPIAIWRKCLIRGADGKYNEPEACLRSHTMASMAGTMKGGPQ